MLYWVIYTRIYFNPDRFSQLDYSVENESIEYVTSTFVNPLPLLVHMQRNPKQVKRKSEWAYPHPPRNLCSLLGNEGGLQLRSYV